MKNAARTSWEEANGFKKLDSGASTMPESSQRQIRNHLRTSNFQGCFLEECRIRAIGCRFRPFCILHFTFCIHGAVWCCSGGTLEALR